MPSPPIRARAFRPRPASAASRRRRRCRSRTPAAQPEEAFQRGRETRQTAYSQPFKDSFGNPVFQVADPADRARRLQRRADRRVLGRAAAALLRADRDLAPACDLAARREDQSLASTVMTVPGTTAKRPSIVFELPVAPAENGLVLRGQGYRTSIGLIGNTLFWMVMAALGADRLDAARHLAAHAPAAADAGRARLRDQLPPRHGELDADRHARHGHGRPISYVNPAFCAMTGFSEADLIGQHPPFPYWPHDRREENARLLEQELRGQEPGRRHRGQGDAEGRLGVRRPHVRLAADRPEGPADRLDDLDDQHHRGQAHPRPAHRLARALHDRARGPRHRRVGALGAAGRAAVRQPLVPALVRRRCEAAMRSSPAATPRCRCRSTATTRSTRSAACRRRSSPPPAPTRARSSSRRSGKWFDVRARYLQWTDGRLAQMLIATDITERRNAEAVAAQPGREGAGDEPAGDDGRDGVVGRARAEPAAHRHHQLLQRHGDAGRERRHRQGRPDRGAAEDLAPGRAGRADHPSHPRLREAQRAAAAEGLGADDRRRRRRPRRHRAAAAQRRDPDLRGAAPAAADGRPDPDRAGRPQPAEERRRGDRQRPPAERRAGASSCASCRGTPPRKAT